MSMSPLRSVVLQGLLDTSHFSLPSLSVFDGDSARHSKKQNEQNANTSTTTTTIAMTAQSSTSRLDPRRRILILAAAPRDERHIYTLWTELECFTENVNKVLLALPDWSQDMIQPFVDLVRTHIPHFVAGQVELEVKFFVNDRYDVGLWCDGLQSLYQADDHYDEYGLLNDSVFALRRFSAVLDVLQERNLQLSSLSFSHSAKHFRGFGDKFYWVESVFRGLDPRGLEVFRNHSCLPADHSAFCPRRNQRNRKICIIHHFEHDLAAQFANRSDVHGLYPTDVHKPNQGKPTWAVNDRHWRNMVDTLGFPVAKENRQHVIRNVTDEEDILLQNCTRYLQPRSALHALQLDFSKAQNGLQSRRKDRKGQKHDQL